MLVPLLHMPSLLCGKESSSGAKESDSQFFPKERDLAGFYLVPQGRKLEEATQHCECTQWDQVFLAKATL